ncbi:MAG: aspartate carbamoyltransferase catalytic subunit [Candidatus Symbiobacter sp.]|nr:aspartate carbamoyltransferase catalytic subunit [Candidatus Symbiobacter sp.]
MVKPQTKPPQAHPTWQEPPSHSPHTPPGLLGIEGMAAAQITHYLDRAEYYLDQSLPLTSDQKILAGHTVINLFFENSTRTRASFEIAAKRLGADVINMAVEHSSIKKGETLIDTAVTLNAMRPDLLVVRHHESGAVALLASKVSCAVINAGDGSHEHPTQALLDALTIRRHKKCLHGLNIAICGDVRHSRVARSNIHLLTKMGAHIRLIAPPTLIPRGIEQMGVTVYHDMQDGLGDCDIIMMLRLQNERMNGAFVPSPREYFHFYGLDRQKLSYAKQDALVMHPGPMNRGVEIDSEIADDTSSNQGGQSVIQNQVAAGVATRLACLEILFHQTSDARERTK